MSRLLVGEPVVDKKHVDELILRDYGIDRTYTCHPIKFAAGTYVIGEVIVDADDDIGDSAIGAAPDFTDAICLENIVVPEGQTIEVPCLCRGPALVNLDAVVRETVSEAEEDDETLIARLADLISQGIRFTREPVLKTVGDRNA